MFSALQAIPKEKLREFRKFVPFPVRNGRFFLPNQEAERIRPRYSARIALVRLLALAILALVLCSCADSYDILGVHLQRASDDDRDNAGHGYVSGSGDPGE
jgi:hypothetical protein